MTRQVLPALLAALAMTACQSDQTLPFEQQVASKTIPASGGVVSSPAGASITFPSGALATSTTVTVTPQATATVSVGTPSGASGIQSIAVTPAGQALTKPATVEAKLASTSADRWLSVLLAQTPGGWRVFPLGSVDVTNNVLRTDVNVLGTFTPIIPPANARFQVTTKTAVAAR